MVLSELFECSSDAHCRSWFLENLPQLIYCSNPVAFLFFFGNTLNFEYWSEELPILVNSWQINNNTYSNRGYWLGKIWPLLDIAAIWFLIIIFHNLGFFFFLFKKTISHIHASVQPWNMGMRSHILFQSTDCQRNK